MKNKYYLTSVKLNQDDSKCTLYYECTYQNGIDIKIITIAFSENLTIKNKLD